MKIKTRLFIGLGFLFANIVILGIIGASQIRLLSNETKNILTANYNTLDYSRNMLMAMDRIHSDTAAVSLFLTNLTRQQGNITEPGEHEATDRLAHHFEELLKAGKPGPIDIQVRDDLYKIMLLNMNAISRKSEIAAKTADSSTRWIVITASLSFLLSFTLLINLPGSIANPIRDLTQSIKLIADKEYKERVNFTSSSEFGELAEAFNSMAAKLEEYDSSNIAKLLIEKKRIETLINKLHHPIIGLDERDSILFGNDEALSILGVKPANFIGRSATELAITNDLMRSLLQRLKHPDQFEGKQPLKIYTNGRESYFEPEVVPITIVPTGGNKERNIGYVMILQNITPFKERDFAKTNFMATVSHELKTPLSSIKMGVDLFRRNSLNSGMTEEQLNLLNGINEDADRLLGITSELLKLSQVESGQIQLSMTASSPAQIIQYATDAVRMAVGAKSLQLKTDIHSTRQVMADMEKSAWVLTNLLSNATRYAPEGSAINISVDDEADHIWFSVSDMGKGIDPEYREKIFSKYFRVPGNDRDGTGLGLAISKEFIEAQGGTIMVQSEPGKGSTFRFSLMASA